MKRTSVKCAIGLMAITVSAACSDRQVQTELEPEGPPVIKQVLMQARVTLENDVQRNLTQLAYGAHPEINNTTSITDLQTTVGPVLAAIARSNRLRVVFDELLVGNNLEEIACADGSYSRVPRGTTPDDIARCSGSDATALQGCTGDHAVCIGADGPIGILDEDMDGAVDDMRMIDGIFSIDCDGANIPWHREQSFYQPAGNQLISAGPLGVNSLGPAIVIVPANAEDDLLSGMRTGSSCALTFTDAIIDKDGNQTCAPPDGDDCTPGDTSGITWTVEPLRLLIQSPADGAVNVALGNPDSSALMQFNAAIDDATVAGITIADESGVIPDCASPPVAQCVQRSRRSDDPTLITLTIVGGYTAENVHTITVPTSVTDVFGGPLPAEIVYSFTTRAATPTADAAPDADPADADIDAP